MRYPVLVDGETGAYGVAFPDLPGCVAMGSTIDEALLNAEDALRDWVESMEQHRQVIPEPSPLETVEVPDGSSLASVLLIRTAPEAPRGVRVNLVLDPGVADAITSEAQRRGMSRKTYIEWMTRRIAQMGG